MCLLRTDSVLVNLKCFVLPLSFQLLKSHLQFGQIPASSFTLSIESISEYLAVIG
jgi:hypothetical protein